MRRSSPWVLSLVVAGDACGVARSEPITTGSLVEEMIDMKRLAEFPEPFFDTVQFSSYDRRSSIPGGPEWFANSDGFGKEPIPNFEQVLVEPNAEGVGEYLMGEVQGPGAIARTWTAAIHGTIRLYLDDMDKPVYDGPAAEFCLHPYKRFAEQAGVDPAVFANTFQQRNACYLPMPFSKGCRIVWIGKVQEIHFYQIQVRRYASGTQVTTFRPEDLKTYDAQIRKAAKILAEPQGEWRHASKLQPVGVKATIKPQETAEVASIEGPKAVERLTLKVNAADLDRALRQTVLRIVFDDHPWGQVEAPIGDFFGAAPGINPMDTVPFTVDAGGAMTCRFVMPFAKSCKIHADNLGDQEVTVSGSLLPAEYAWNDKTSMYFRARWRVDHDLVANEGNLPEDLPYVVARGAGRFLGVTAILLNPNSVPTPGGNWWGEGDEKIFVDGDIRPSTFGTGSEDYFNYAWSSPDIFVFPYCGQPRNDGPANRGFVTNFRWQILDAMPFRERLAFYMELFSHERTPGVSYARIAYLYGRPNLIDDHVRITRADVRHLELPKSWQPAARGGSRNSTFFEAEALVQERAGTALVKHDLWSGGQKLVWKPSAKGDELKFKLPVADAGRYAVRFTFAHTPESGRISASLDGKSLKLGGDAGFADLQVPHRVLSRVHDTPPDQLSQGDHELTLRSEGGSQGDAPGEIGIDFIWIQKR